jgi:tetratricopeptide (TPR) repeat protein
LKQAAVSLTFQLHLPVRHLKSPSTLETQLQTAGQELFMKLKAAATTGLILFATTCAMASQRINPEVVRLNKLATERMNAHDWDAAERDYLRALDIAAQSEAKHTIATLHQNLGTVYATANRYGDAEKQFRSSYELLKAEYGEQHPKVALALNRIAEMICFEGRFADARPMFERSLSIFNSQNSRDPEVSRVLTNVAASEWLAGNLSRAAKALDQVTTLLKTAGKDWQPQLAFAFQIRARIADQVGDSRGAETFSQQAVSILEQSGAPEDLAGALVMVAQRHLSQGDTKQAQARLERAQQVAKSGAVEESPVGAALMRTLAVCYQKQGKSGEADTFFQRAIGINQRVLGPDHPNLLYAMEDYAHFLRETKRKKDAKRLESYVKSHTPENGSSKSANNVVDFRQLLLEQKH